MDTKEKQDGIQDHLDRKILGLGFTSADMTDIWDLPLFGDPVAYWNNSRLLSTQSRFSGI